MGTRHRGSLLVVFAGGPHTGSRVASARRAAAACSPDRIILTGHEFYTTHARLIEKMKRECGEGLVTVHDAPNTWMSCRYLHSFLCESCEPNGDPRRMTVITSNYHRPRLAWLLHGALADARIAVEYIVTPDMRPRDLLHTRTARKLIRGEFTSWIYCAPLGLWWRLRALLLRLSRRHPPAA